MPSCHLMYLMISNFERHGVFTASIMKCSLWGLHVYIQDIFYQKASPRLGLRLCQELFPMTACAGLPVSERAGCWQWLCSWPSMWWASCVSLLQLLLQWDASSESRQEWAAPPTDHPPNRLWQRCYRASGFWGRDWRGCVRSSRCLASRRSFLWQWMPLDLPLQTIEP